MKSSRRRKTPQQKPDIPFLIFTVDELKVLRKALAPLEKRLLLTNGPLPNLQFARETVTQVQAKVERMLQQNGWREKVGFDVNEVLLLRTALWLYSAGLQMVEASKERDRLLFQCSALYSKLSRK